jgi:hypothetical protein
LPEALTSQSPTQIGTSKKMESPKVRACCAHKPAENKVQGKAALAEEPIGFFVVTVWYALQVQAPCSKA